MLSAQRLPVGLIPKQRLVATMRDDVIDDRRDDRLVLLGALDAQRMGLQEESAGSAPTMIVATLCGVRSLLAMREE
jgi:hypothetical protein